MEVVESHSEHRKLEEDCLLMENQDETDIPSAEIKEFVFDSHYTTNGIDSSDDFENENR